MTLNTSVMNVSIATVAEDVGTTLSYAGMDVSRDNGLVVDAAYEDKAPYEFTGTVKQVVFDLEPAGHEDAKALHHHEAVHAVAHGVSA